MEKNNKKLKRNHRFGKKDTNIKNLLSCETKKRYFNIIDAEEALRSYRNAILLSNMNFYWCKNHNCFHLGHNRFMKNELIVNNKSLRHKETNNILL